MKIAFASDLHLEFSKGKLAYVHPDCDIMILAGDIASGVRGVMWAAETFTVPVIYVCGNHEFYGHRVISEHLKKLREKAEGTNVTVLQNETLKIGDVSFFGATLWTDYNLYGNQYLSMLQAKRSMNDYEQIAYSYDTSGRKVKLDPDNVLREHMISRFSLEEFLRTTEGKKVVVTHHGPSHLSIHPKYGTDISNAWYSSDLSELLLDYSPELYIHGHTHHSFDYTIGETRVMTNPRGYPYCGHQRVPENPEFNPKLIVEI